MKNTAFSSKQRVYTELVIGSLIYVVALGFFNDYTDTVTARSFSSLFYAAFVLQVLTLLALQLKNRIILSRKDLTEKSSRAITIFFIWLVLFFSKFIFIWVIDWIFGEKLEISGFFVILLLVASVTLLYKLTEIIFNKLADT